MDTQTQMDLLENLLENLKLKRIPISGEQDRTQKMNQILPIFEQFSSIAEKTRPGPTKMKVWANPRHLNGFHTAGIYLTSNMSDHQEDRIEEAIFGITCGSGNHHGKGYNSFTGDLQVRFFHDEATIRTWYLEEPHEDSRAFARLVDRFMTTEIRDMFPGIEDHLMGRGTEFSIKKLSDALLFPNLWRKMLAPLLPL